MSGRNNNETIDKVWADLFTAKDKSELSETARKIIDEIITLGDKINKNKKA